ncbi:putative EAL domain protein regulator [Escherichia coli]|nr:putative EAL domain protein regulator [Escherichia coli]
MNPAEFIPLAEKEGMIEQITDYVIDNVFRDLGDYLATHADRGNDSNLLIVFYVQIMPDDFVMQLHRF